MNKKIFPLCCFGLFYVSSCISQENPPEVEIPDQSKFETEIIVDGIEIPWGMDFIKGRPVLHHANDIKVFFFRIFLVGFNKTHSLIGK